MPWGNQEEAQEESDQKVKDGIWSYIAGYHKSFFFLTEGYHKS